MDYKKVLLLNSGGADSFSSAIILKNAGFEIFSLFIDYGQPAKVLELPASMSVHHLLELPFFGHHFMRTLDFASNFSSEEKEIAGQEIYLRSFVMMSYASQLAYTLGIGNIATGYSGMQDAMTYVDDNPCFIQDFHKMTYDYFGIRIMTPVSGFNKDMIWSTIMNEGIDPSILPYCNTPINDEQCGTCHKCRLTNDALDKLKGDLKWQI